MKAKWGCLMSAVHDVASSMKKIKATQKMGWW